MKKVVGIRIRIEQANKNPDLYGGSPPVEWNVLNIDARMKDWNIFQKALLGSQLRADPLKKSFELCAASPFPKTPEMTLLLCYVGQDALQFGVVG